MDKRVSDEDDAALMKEGRNADGAIFGAGVENVVDQVKDVSRFSGRAGDEGVAMIVSQHERCKDHHPQWRELPDLR